MRVYWWDEKPNFGDRLNVFLLQKMLGVTPEWAAPKDAEAVVIGSVLDVLPPSWYGIVAGAGKLHARTVVPPRAKVIGVRGLLTGDGIPGYYAVGDPALMVDELIPAQEKSHDLGVVPHWTDRALADRFAHLDPFVINPAWTPERVVIEIARCKKIVASSLHGIVVADAFGLPRRAEPFPKMNSRYEGGVFKFEDYSSGIGYPMQFGVLETPPRGPIERAQAEIFGMVKHLGGLLDAND